jgi:hypothetical protein
VFSSSNKNFRVSRLKRMARRWKSPRSRKSKETSTWVSARGSECQIQMQDDSTLKIGNLRRLLTIYDCRVVMSWKGMSSTGSDMRYRTDDSLFAGTNGEDEISGTVTVPEVSHECTDGISDYVVSSAQLFLSRSAQC